jgi:hypothetical protein
VASGLLLKHDEDKRVIESTRAGDGLAVVDRRSCGGQGQAKRQTLEREDARLLLGLLWENNFRKFGGRVRRIGMARSPMGYEI